MTFKTIKENAVPKFKITAIKDHMKSWNHSDKNSSEKEGQEDVLVISGSKKAESAALFYGQVDFFC